MAITNGYATLAEIKARLGITDTTDDTILESVVEAISRMIDDYCARHFYQSSTTRYFTAEWGDLLRVPDLVSVSSLKTDDDGDRVYETVWATSDYDLVPYNASELSKPYTRIEVTPNGNYSFPTTPKGVEIIGTWGWPAIPKPIKEACLLQAQILFKRKDAIFGVIGGGELGQPLRITGLDPQVQRLLAPFRRVGLEAV